MKLSFQKIKEITKGAVRFSEHDGVLNFLRFTEEQTEFYEHYNEDFYRKTFATAGVRLSFKTDSSYLRIKGKLSPTFASSRSYYSFDVTVNGEYIGSVDNYGDADFSGDYSKIDLPRCDYDKTFELSCGEKTVTVYFPYTIKADLEEVSVSDGAYVEPIHKQDKWLAFGDSITHGYDSLRNICHYTHRLSDALDVELINKGIGGEVFKPELAACRDAFDPKFITVAYGANDWSKLDRETFVNNCRGFYKNLSENYPDSPIFAITPVWRGDMDANKKFGPFADVEKEMNNCTKELENVTVISGFDLVPHDGKYYGDLRLHPSNDGFEHYFNNLYSKLKNLLDIHCNGYSQIFFENL